MIGYLLLQGAGCWQHLCAQAPRVREATARATTAAILVMVMEYFASFLCKLRYGSLIQIGGVTRR